MNVIHRRLALLFFLLASLGFQQLAYANQKLVKGIYLTQTTLENTAYLTYLIDHSKAVGITTFVIDMEKPSKKYEKNIALLKNNGIQYIARVVVFPEGGKPDQIASPVYWEKRYNLVKTAMDYGAEEIQLDYIRYNTKQHASADNAKNIFKVVEFFKDKVAARKIPLQVDVFGISSFGESKHIGQNIRLLAESVDAMCPMVYPSHYEPFREHAITPYETVYSSLKAFHKQFEGKVPFKLYAYIEISNYRFPLPGEKRRAYVVAQMKAVEDAGADGWYVWSAHNKYDYLFSLMGQLALEEKNSAAKTTMLANANGNASIDQIANTANLPKYMQNDANLGPSKNAASTQPTNAEIKARIALSLNNEINPAINIKALSVDLSKNTTINPLASKLPLLDHLFKTQL